MTCHAFGGGPHSALPPSHLRRRVPVAIKLENESFKYTACIERGPPAPLSKYPDHLYDSLSSLIATGTRGLKCDGGKAEWGPPPKVDRHPRVAKPFEVAVKLLGDEKTLEGVAKTLERAANTFERVARTFEIGGCDGLFGDADVETASSGSRFCFAVLRVETTNPHKN